jgi:hypothetical protein
MAQTAHTKKGRLTVSLSHDTLEYLETSRDQAQAPSMSAYFESLKTDGGFTAAFARGDLGCGFPERSAR